MFVDLGTAQWAKIDANVIGDNTLVAAVADKRILVTNILLVVSLDVDVTFLSGVGGTELSGPMSLGSRGGFAPPPNPQGHTITGVGEALVLNLANAASCQASGWLTYELVG